jgi:hypothetical protein
MRVNSLSGRRLSKTNSCPVPLELPKILTHGQGALCGKIGQEVSIINRVLIEQGIAQPFLKSSILTQQLYRWHLFHLATVKATLSGCFGSFLSEPCSLSGSNRRDLDWDLLNSCSNRSRCAVMAIDDDLPAFYVGDFDRMRWVEPIRFHVRRKALDLTSSHFSRTLTG